MTVPEGFEITLFNIEDDGLWRLSNIGRDGNPLEFLPAFDRVPGFDTLGQAVDHIVRLMAQRGYVTHCDVGLKFVRAAS